MSPQRVAAFGNDLGTELVKIHVGSKRKEFVVHKNLICQKSDFSLKAYTGNFQEGQEGVVYLPEETPDVFALFIDWLYRPCLPDIDNEVQFYNFIKLYIFAEKICINKLADVAIDQIQQICVLREHITSPLTPELTKYVYAKTRVGSQLRKFCLHTLAYELSESFATPFPALHHIESLRNVFKDGSDFLVDYIVYLKNNSDEMPCPSDKQTEHGGCYYHSHEANSDSGFDPKTYHEVKVSKWEELGSDEVRRSLLSDETSQED